MVVDHAPSNVFLKIRASRMVIHPGRHGVSMQMALIKSVSMRQTVKENQLWKQTDLVHARFNAFQIHVFKMAIPQEHLCVKIQMAQHKNVLTKGWLSKIISREVPAIIPVHFEIHFEVIA